MRTNTDMNIFFRRELAELQAEAKYFCIEELAEAAEKSMKNLKEKETDVTPICRVPLITSQKEEQVNSSIHFHFFTDLALLKEF